MQDQEPAQDKDTIDWDGEDDPAHPMNWPVSRKWLITITMGIMTFFITFSSSIFSAATHDIADKYHVSSVVATLGTALFVLVCMWTRWMPSVGKIADDR